MATRQFRLNEKERAGLRGAESVSERAREMKRLQAVRLYGEGKAASEIEAVVGCDRRTLMRWVGRYRVEGVAGLVDRRRGGNAAKLTKQQRQTIREKVQQYQPAQVLPAEMRLSRGVFWTVSDLRVAVELWYGVTYQSPTSYLTLLHECGFSQQKVEKQYRSRPNEAAIADFEAELEKK